MKKAKHMYIWVPKVFLICSESMWKAFWTYFSVNEIGLEMGLHLKKKSRKDPDSDEEFGNADSVDSNNAVVSQFSRDLISFFLF